MQRKQVNLFHEPRQTKNENKPWSYRTHPSFYVAFFPSRFCIFLVRFNWRKYMKFIIYLRLGYVSYQVLLRTKAN